MTTLEELEKFSAKLEEIKFFGNNHKRYLGQIAWLEEKMTEANCKILAIKKNPAMCDGGSYPTLPSLHSWETNQILYALKSEQHRQALILLDPSIEPLD